MNIIKKNKNLLATNMYYVCVVSSIVSPNIYNTIGSCFDFQKQFW